MEITYSNIKRSDKIPFDQYLNLDGYSHSFLKREHNGIATEVTITENITIGKLVDAILTEPESADMRSPLYGVAKNIAFEIDKSFGKLIALFEKQVSYTCDIEYNGFIMPSKGRLDFLLPGHAVIDLKFTKVKALYIPALVDHFGYKNQLWHYCKMAGVTRAYLMIYSQPAKRTFLYQYDCASDMNEFWADKTMQFGKVAVHG